MRHFMLLQASLISFNCVSVVASSAAGRTAPSCRDNTRWSSSRLGVYKQTNELTVHRNGSDLADADKTDAIECLSYKLVSQHLSF